MQQQQQPTETKKTEEPAKHLLVNTSESKDKETNGAATTSDSKKAKGIPTLPMHRGQRLQTVDAVQAQKVVEMNGGQQKKEDQAGDDKKVKDDDKKD